MWWMKFLLFLILCKFDNALLIRPISIYQSIIADMHKRYKFDSLTLLHGHTLYSTSESMDLTTKLTRLQIYFAKLWIPTAIMSIEHFKKQEIPSINQLQKPIFVFLNDFDDLKNQLTPEFLSVVAKSERVSLIFFRDETEIEIFLKNMYIPFDCQFMVSQRNLSNEKYEIITEVYRLAEHGKLQQDFLTSWNPVTGMQLPKMFLHHRRTNLHGHNIKVGWIEDWSFINPLRRNKSENDRTIIILNTMKRNLNLNITFDMTEYMGNCYNNNTCNYAVDKLISKKLDIIGEPISIYRKIIQKGLVDYSMTFYQTYCDFFIQKPQSLKWTKYGNLFHHDLWIALGVHMLMTSVAIIFIEYKKKAMFLEKKLQKLISLNVTDICFRVWAIFNNQGVSYSKYSQIQILQFVGYLLFIVIYAMYSAKLVSFLAADQEEIQFHSIDELLKDKTYQLGVAKYSEIYYRFEETDNKVKHKFSQLQIDSKQLPRNSLEGFYRLCQDQKYAFADFRAFSDFFVNTVNNSCEIRQIKSSSYMFSFILQKGSPLKRYLNQIILKLREQGVYKAIRFYMDKDAYPTSISAVDTFHVLPLFAFLGLSMLLSIIILFYEISVHKLKQNSLLKSKKILNIVKWPSKGIYRLRHGTLKAKYRRGIKRKY